MFYDVIVREASPGQYSAVVWGNPEVRATGTTEQEAIEEVKRLLTEWMAKARWVRVDVPTPGYVHPALEFTGRVDPNDPTEKEYLEEIARYRRAVDEREQQEEPAWPSDSSSTPTT